MTDTKEKTTLADAWRLLTEQANKRPGAGVLIQQALQEMQWDGSLQDYHDSTTTPDDEKIEQYRKILQLIMGVKRDSPVRVGPFKTADELFKELCAAIKTAGGDTHKKIAAHLRGHTGRFIALAVYHNDTSVTQDAKVTLYTELLAAVKSKDFAKLSGTVGAGDKRSEESEASETLPPEMKTATRATTPEPPLESTALNAVTLTPARRAVKSTDKPPVEIEADAATDDLAAAIIKAIGPRLVQPAPPAMDEQAIRTVVKHALGNGEFPTDRVQALIDLSVAALRAELTQHIESTVKAELRTTFTFLAKQI